MRRLALKKDGRQMRYDFSEDEIQLPAEIAEAGRTAKLPKAYDYAKRWLAECDNDAIDKIADWSNKMEALATLARLNEDEELENMARRIRARCYRKMGEILKEFDARGGNRSKNAPPSRFAQFAI
jgi:hypothetical protein